MQDFEIESFEEFETSEMFTDDAFETRYIKPLKTKERQKHFLKYANAEKLATEIILEKESCFHCIVNGSFIFGDFIEAFIVHNNAHVLKMTISTLSMDESNVDSLAELMEGGFVDDLDLIVSGFHYSHKRWTIVDYTYKHLDTDKNNFQLAVADCHTKICLMETDGGKKIVIHGSANLVSSGCLEQFTIEENEALYDFYFDYHQKIIELYKTIDKTVRGKKLWGAINN